MEKKIEELRELLKTYNGAFSRNLFGEVIIHIGYDEKEEKGFIEGSVYHARILGKFDFKNSHFFVESSTMDDTREFYGEKAINKGIGIINFWKESYGYLWEEAIKNLKEVRDEC